MASCNDQIARCLPSGCGCLQYDPITGQLAIDGELVKLYTQATGVASAETLLGASLNPTVKVPVESINGLCGGVAKCMSTLPPGSIDVTALKPGAEGTVLQTIGGKTVWAGLEDAAIQKAFGDNPIPQPPIDQTELAKVYGETAGGALTSVKPQGAYESAVAGMPLVSPAIPLKQISGVDAGGMAVKANIIKNGATLSSTAPAFPKTRMVQNAIEIMASVIAPADGLYAVSIYVIMSRFLVDGWTDTNPINFRNIALVFGVTKGTDFLYHSGSDYTITLSPSTTYAAGAGVGASVRIGQVATVYLLAGDKLDFKVFNVSQGPTLDVSTGAPPVITLTTLGPLAIAP
jgi:hypothetical protein